MPKTLYAGSQGPDVKTLQSKLNAALPNAKPALAVDGIFGPLTLARVRAFQQSKGLVVDGIVGPKTWAALDAPNPPNYTKVWERCGCAAMYKSGAQARFHDHARSSGFSSVQHSYGPKAFQNASFGDAAPASSDDFWIGRTTETMRGVLDPVYGDSISYTNVFVTNQSGAGGRAFVLTVPAPIGGRYTAIQYVNLGTSFDNHTLIHEFGHVWQAQHHSSPTAYMINALASQGAEEIANAAEGTNKWSAYAYKLDKNLALYGAEQLAQMIADDEGGMRSRVRGFSKFELAVWLIPAPGVPFIEKRGEPGVK